MVWPLIRALRGSDGINALFSGLAFLLSARFAAETVPRRSDRLSGLLKSRIARYQRDLETGLLR